MWVDDFEKEMAKYFDTPDEFIQAIGYFSAGAALANRVWVRSPKYVGTNLYLILCSPPGWYHKSSTISTAMDMLRLVIPKEEILPSNPSMEALGRKIPSICKDEVGHGILMYDEFRSFLAHVRKEYAAPVASLVTEKLERGMPVTFSKTKDSGTEEFTIPGKFTLSFIASTTTPWLLENIRGSDISGGMMSRFLLVEAHQQTRTYELPAPVDERAMAALASDLSRIRNNHQKGTEFTFRQSASRLYASIYRNLKEDAEKHGHPEYPSLVSRGPLYLKKLSLLNAALMERGSTVIEEEDVEIAAELVWKSVKSCRRIVDEAAAQDGVYGRTLIRVRNIMQGAQQISKGDLLRVVHVRPRELDEILDSLTQQGLIEWDRQDGNPVIVWKGHP
jgi:hypothetical protein